MIQLQSRRILAHRADHILFDALPHSALDFEGHVYGGTGKSCEVGDHFVCDPASIQTRAPFSLTEPVWYCL